MVRGGYSAPWSAAGEHLIRLVRPPARPEIGPDDRVSAGLKRPTRVMLQKLEAAIPAAQPPASWAGR
jgi:hypothetical protein